MAELPSKVLPAGTDISKLGLHPQARSYPQRPHRRPLKVAVMLGPAMPPAIMPVAGAGLQHGHGTPFNLAWKLAWVLSAPDTPAQTYKYRARARPTPRRAMIDLFVAAGRIFYPRKFAARRDVSTWLLNQIPRFSAISARCAMPMPSATGWWHEKLRAGRRSAACSSSRVRTSTARSTVSDDVISAPGFALCWPGAPTPTIG